MKKKQLSKSDIKQLNSEIEKYNIQLDKKDKVEIFDNSLVVVNSSPFFFKHDSGWVPTLKLELEKSLLKKAVVDMGAIKFVVNGADVMRPGISEIDESIKNGEVISIVDINNKKPIAIGQALASGVEINQQDSGRSIKNMHYIGDKIWESIK